MEGIVNSNKIVSALHSMAERGDCPLLFNKNIHFFPPLSPSYLFYKSIHHFPQPYWFTQPYYFQQLLVSFDGGQAVRKKCHLVAQKKKGVRLNVKTKAHPAPFSLSQTPNKVSCPQLSLSQFQILLTSFLLLFIVSQQVGQKREF